MTDLRETAQRWLALWNGDMHLLGEIVAGDAVTHAVMIGQVVETPMVGRDALGDWIAQMHMAMPSLRFAVEVGPLVDGDLIALRWRIVGTHGTTRIDFAGTDILRIEHGRIMEYWVNSDTSLMLAQMQATVQPIPE